MKTILGTTLLMATALLLGGGCSKRPALKVASQTARAARVETLADEELDHLRQINAYVRLQSGLPVAELDDITLENAQREAAFSQEMLKKVEALPIANLPDQEWLLARMLQDTLQSGVHGEEDYWLNFAVTPYNVGNVVLVAQQILAAQTFNTAQSDDNYLHLLDEYAMLLNQMASKTIAQTQRGIRVPRPAIPGIIATFQNIKASAAAALSVSAKRLAGLPVERAAALRDAITKRITERVVPAHDQVLAIFDDSYMKQAPEAVGLGQYPGGKQYYLRLIKYQTGLDLTPQQIHDRGLTAVAELERQMQEIRDRIGFKGTQEQFHASLRTDPRFIAKTPAEVERRYLEHVKRIEPHVPQYFSTLPQAPYGVMRLDPGAEPGQTYGYYQAPTPGEPIGYYRYNGSNLDKRSLVTSAHLIYHELIPGHHFHIGLQTEKARRKEMHPLREFLLYGAFTEGWADYGADLAVEMGALEDPYYLYGHRVLQSFLAARLVVDTGMNYFGWSREKAITYLKAHSFESDLQLASESLRYSTDLYAQALTYRVGYEKFWELRHRAEKALRKDFDIRTFHSAALGEGAMPLDVLDEHIDRFIRKEKKRLEQIH